MPHVFEQFVHSDQDVPTTGQVSRKQILDSFSASFDSLFLFLVDVPLLQVAEHWDHSDHGHSPLKQFCSKTRVS